MEQREKFINDALNIKDEEQRARILEKLANQMKCLDLPRLRTILFNKLNDIKNEKNLTYALMAIVAQAAHLDSMQYLGLMQLTKSIKAANLGVRLLSMWIQTIDSLSDEELRREIIQETLSLIKNLSIEQYLKASSLGSLSCRLKDVPENLRTTVFNTLLSIADERLQLTVLRSLVCSARYVSEDQRQRLLAAVTAVEDKTDQAAMLAVLLYNNQPPSIQRTQ